MPTTRAPASASGRTSSRSAASVDEGVDRERNGQQEAWGAGGLTGVGGWFAGKQIALYDFAIPLIESRPAEEVM